MEETDTKYMEYRWVLRHYTNWLIKNDLIHPEAMIIDYEVAEGFLDGWEEEHGVNG